ncbi:MAG: hypothetical protein BWX79_03030 [Alphaproteobacteria bacterium ADurb.Bin100]|nr:MAG: hypothetical protein BWX79_03030 [Alphaproteobacteria bacterium ADurb.Bin100]
MQTGRQIGARHRNHAAGVLAHHELHIVAATVQIGLPRKAAAFFRQAVLLGQPMHEAKGAVAVCRADHNPVVGLRVGQRLGLGQAHRHHELAHDRGGCVLSAAFHLLAQREHTAPELLRRLARRRQQHRPGGHEQAPAAAVMHDGLVVVARVLADSVEQGAHRLLRALRPMQEPSALVEQCNVDADCRVVAQGVFADVFHRGIDAVAVPRQARADDTFNLFLTRLCFKGRESAVHGLKGIGNFLDVGNLSRRRCGPQTIGIHPCAR